MFEKSEKLLALFNRYTIDRLGHGAREDKIGDVFEDYCVILLKNHTLLVKAQNNQLNKNDTDEFVYSLLAKYLPNLGNIAEIEATRDIEHRYTGGNPKTDVIADIHYRNGNVLSLPISVKQTTASKVAMAEFDVATIKREIGITDNRLVALMEKHQRDASAKNFTESEKDELVQRLKPYKVKFVKWVVSGSSVDSENLKFPKVLLKFQLEKPVDDYSLEEISEINCYTIDEYVDHILYSRNGMPNKGGFETGLSWTYATGSKGYKIQFKG